MKKIGIWTIILILFALGFIYSAYNYNSDRNVKYEECNDLQEKIPQHKVDAQINKVYDYNYDIAWDKWESCLDSYGSLFMMYDIQKSLAWVFIFLIIISWRVDILNEKKSFWKK